MSSVGHQAWVIVFDHDERIVGEIPYALFSQTGYTTHLFMERAASVARAAYCAADADGYLIGVVFFQFAISEEGAVDSTFNLPLAHLVAEATTLTAPSNSPLSVASRSQCPVPWHALNLWDPRTPELIQHIEDRMQRVNCTITGGAQEATRTDMTYTRSSSSHEAHRGQVAQAGGNTLRSGDHPPTDTQPNPVSPLSGRSGPLPARAAGPRNSGDRPLTSGASDQKRYFSERLNEVFGAQGKLSMQEMIRLHAAQLEQLNELHAKHIAAYHEELDSLKRALNEAQQRNRRLQARLRHQ